MGWRYAPFSRAFNAGETNPRLKVGGDGGNAFRSRCCFSWWQLVAMLCPTYWKRSRDSALAAFRPTNPTNPVLLAAEFPVNELLHFESLGSRVSRHRLLVVL